MEKVLILTYFYPPSKFTAASRPYSWFRYLYECGYYPVIVTIDWEAGNSGEASRKSPTVKEEGRGEVHFVQLQESLKERLQRAGLTKPMVGKAATFFELIAQNFTMACLPYRDMYSKAERLIQEDAGIHLVIASANPYPLFGMASRLVQDHPHVKWIADYRDDWSTKQLNKQRSLFYRFVYALDRKSERRWLASSRCFISVSQTLIDRIASFIHKPGYLVTNGYFPEDYSIIKPSEDRESFVIAYTGILYPEQDLEAFLEVFSDVRLHYHGKVKLCLRFIGLEAFLPGRDRVIRLTANITDSVEIIPLVPREVCLDLESAADVLLMMAYGSEKGIPSSKLFQYLGHQKPIMVYPGDEDIIDHIVADESGLGERLPSAGHAKAFLSKCIEYKLKGRALPYQVAGSAATIYSRKVQTERLSEIFTMVLHED